MKLRTIFLLAIGILVSNTVSASTYVTTLNVSAAISSGTCSASVSPISFSVDPNYDPNTAVLYPGNTTITATCPNGISYNIALDAGLHYQADNSTPLNFVTDGQGDGMAYGLSSVSDFSTFWGDDGVTNSGSSVPATGTGASQSFTVYGGAIPAYSVGTLAQGVSYQDVVNVTINY